MSVAAFLAEACQWAVIVLLAAERWRASRPPPPDPVAEAQRRAMARYREAQKGARRGEAVAVSAEGRPGGRE